MKNAENQKPIVRTGYYLAKSSKNVKKVSKNTKFRQKLTKTPKTRFSTPGPRFDPPHFGGYLLCRPEGSEICTPE